MLGRYSSCSPALQISKYRVPVTYDRAPGPWCTLCPPEYIEIRQKHKKLSNHPRNKQQCRPVTGAEAREDIKVEGPGPGHLGGKMPAGLSEQTRRRPVRKTVTDRSGHAGARLCRACGPAAGWIFFQKQREAVGWF